MTSRAIISLPFTGAINDSLAVRIVVSLGVLLAAKFAFGMQPGLVLMKELGCGGILNLAFGAALEKAQLFHGISPSPSHLWVSADGVSSHRSGATLADIKIIPQNKEA